MDPFHLLESILDHLNYKVLLQDQNGTILYPKDPILLAQIKEILNHKIDENQEIQIPKTLKLTGSHLKKQYFKKQPIRTPSLLPFQKLQKEEKTIYQLNQQTIEIDGQCFLIKQLEDITEQKKQEKVLKLLSEDMISTLPVKELFQKELIDQFLEENFWEQGFAVIMGDIDHFKAVNDLYGHTIGDQVIRKVGTIIKTTLEEFQKKDALATRIGGEEFFIFLPNVSRKEEWEIVETIRAKIETSLIQVDSKIDSTITTSFGIYHTKVEKDQFKTEKQCAEYINHLREIADAALYTSKINGRNRITTYDDALLRALERGLETSSKGKTEQKVFKKLPNKRGSLSSSVGDKKSDTTKRGNEG